MNAIMLAYAPRNFGSNVVSNKRVVISKSPSLNTAPQSIEHLRVKFKTDKELAGRTDFDLVSLGRPAGRSMGSGVTRKDPVAVVSRKRCCSSGREEAHRPRRCAASRESAAVCSEVRRVSRAVLRCVFDKCRSVVPMLPLLVLLSAFQGALCARTGSVYVDDQVQNYLSNFGYLPQSNSEAGNLRSEDQLREAISNLQRFGHIPVTGQIDPETRRLLSRPRCGMPDQPAPGHGTRARRFVQQGAVWNHTDLTWSLQRKPQNLDAGGVREELARALAVWSDHSRLTFREINSDKADIVVSFAKRYHDDSYPFDGRGQILAHAFFPGNGRGGDAHFDDEEIWLLRNAAEDDEGTSLFAVAAHEFGHSLGLSHSSVQGALMYPWYQGLKPNFQLPEDDRLGIQNMYGAKEEKMWGKIPAYLPTEPPRVFTTERPDPRPERPRYPAQYPAIYPDSGYPRHRPAAAPRRPEPTPESPPEYPRRPSYPGHRPEHPERRPQYPERRPHYPERRPEHTPTRYNPDRRPSMVTPRPHVPERRPEEHPTRRTNKYNPESKPHVPHHHTTPRTHFPHTTESPYYPNKPDYPRKSPLPKKPYYPPEKPWRQPDRRPSTEVTPTGQTKAPKPDSCNTNYDAVALIRREVFIFKSQYLWRIGDAGVLEGFPTFINRMWSGLPDNLTHVDAVYERPDKKIVFFIGKQYYVFNANKLESGYPRPLTSLGLPDTLEHLNAAMVWGHNGKTYFYNETMYWKFDEEVGKVELDYPRDMSTWRGVGNNIDTVFQWKDGKTYFFKGKGFWKFNDLHMRVEKDKQILSGPFWMGCPYPGEGEEDFYGGNKQPYQGLPPSPTSTFAVTGASSATRCSLVALAVTILFTCIQCRYILDS